MDIGGSVQQAARMARFGLSGPKSDPQRERESHKRGAFKTRMPLDETEHEFRWQGYARDIARTPDQMDLLLQQWRTRWAGTPFHEQAVEQTYLYRLEKRGPHA
jgi:hypothetical protein